jgi:hypothetical protein
VIAAAVAGLWRIAAGAALFGVCLLAGKADGHIVYGRPTLLRLVGGAERVVHVRVVDAHASVSVEATGESRPVVEVEVREVLKGKGAPGDVVRFASHGHGVARYDDGEEALVFLVPLARSPELDALQASGLRWVSLQEHDARYVLTPETRAPVLEAVRRYVAVESVPGTADRMKALRGVTVDLITSGDPRLAASALQDLVAAQSLPLVTAEDVPRLLAEGVASSKTAIGVRVGLLAELQRRGLVEGTPQWLDLLATTPKPGLLQVVRAAGNHPSPEVDARLVGLLAAEDEEVAAAAALALGNPAHAAAVPALAAALERPESRVRMAAIRGLGRIATPAARQTLATAAEGHDDAASRRRAAAELSTLDR